MKRGVVAAALAVSVGFAASAVLADTAPASPHTSAEWLRLTRAEAAKWKLDAQLAAVEFSDVNFAIGPVTQMPDRTRQAPPTTIMFSSSPPSAQDCVRVSVSKHRLAPQQNRSRQQHGMSPVQVQHFESPWLPYKLPIPDGVRRDPDPVMVAAEMDIGAQCGTAAPFSACRTTPEVALYMACSGPGDATGSPVWTAGPGQYPKTFLTVQRELVGTSLQVLALAAEQRQDQQGALFSGRAASFKKASVILAEPDFPGLWHGMNAAVRPQASLYRPHAVSLTIIPHLQKPSAGLGLGQLYVHYPRITPPLIWIDMTVHFDGGGRTPNMIFGKPTRKSAPLQPRQITLGRGRPPDAGPILRHLISKFPRGCSEVYSTTESSCQTARMLEVVTTRHGGAVTHEQHGDAVYFWLTRQDNPYWLAPGGPIASEFAVITDRAPKGEWL